MNKKHILINKKIKIIIFVIIVAVIFTNIKYIKFKNDYIEGNFIKTSIDNNEFNKLYIDLIAEYETNFNEQNINRSTNIKLATSKLNEKIILPGEIFSFNDVVGRRTEEKGFKLAHVYQNGKIVDGLGGGICQVSSTLYNACLYANLNIIERKSHQFMPAYIEVGRDATVVDGYIDFKFKNTRNYPIKLICSADSGKLKCKIYGKKEETEYNVEVKSEILECIKFKSIYEEDDNIKEKIIVQNGKNGYKSKTYKILKINENIISKELISIDTYNVINEIIKTGIK